MSVDDSRALMQRYFAAVDEWRLDDLGTLFGPSHVAHVDSLPPMTLVEVLPFMGAFPDRRHLVKDVLVDGVIAEHWITADTLGLVQQIVATPAPAR